MSRADLGEKDVLNPSETMEYFVLSQRKFYDLLNNTNKEDFLAYYGERKLIIRVAFEQYLLNHPESTKQGYVIVQRLCSRKIEKLQFHSYHPWSALISLSTCRSIGK